MDTLLIFAHGGDTTANWAASELERRLGARRVVRATPEDFALAPRWSHAIDRARIDTQIVLRDGTEIASESLCLVLNRVRAISAPQFAAAHVDDQRYASMELFALLVSWLASLSCPVVNPISPRGFSDPGWHPLTWQRLARRAGLPTREQLLTSSSRRTGDRNLVTLERAWRDVREIDPFRCVGDRPEWLVAPAGDARTRVVVIGDRAIGKAPIEIRDGAVRLARLTSLPLLELWFGVLRDSPEQWFFAGASTHPEITEREELEALVAYLSVTSNRSAQARGHEAEIADSAPSTVEHGVLP